MAWTVQRRPGYANSSTETITISDIPTDGSGNYIFGGKSLLGINSIQANVASVSTFASDMKVQDNTITVNSGEAKQGVTAGTAGILVDRGTATQYQFIFDESDDTFKIGEVGALQKVATRVNEENNKIPIWNSSTNSLDFTNTLNKTNLEAIDQSLGTTSTPTFNAIYSKLSASPNDYLYSSSQAMTIYTANTPVVSLTPSSFDTRNSNYVMSSVDKLYMAYYDGNSTTNKMVYDVQNGRVGIGDTSPTYTLSARTSDEKVLSLDNNTTNGTQYSRITFSSAGTPKSAIEGCVYGDNAIRFFNNHADLSTPQMVLSDTKLGIGGVPNAGLDVKTKIGETYATFGDNHILGYGLGFNIYDYGGGLKFSKANYGSVIKNADNEIQFFFSNASGNIGDTATLNMVGKINKDGLLETTTISANHITDKGFEFHLGNGDQVSRGDSGYSRAIIKDASNTLAINYANDFTGGTRIDSKVGIGGGVGGYQLAIQNSSGANLMLDNATQSGSQYSSILFSNGGTGKAKIEGCVWGDNTIRFFNNPADLSAPQMILKGACLGLGTTPQYGVDIETNVGTTYLKCGSSTPAYLMNNAVGFNMFYDGTNWKYGKGSSSNYASCIQQDEGKIRFYVSTQGDEGATASRICPLYISTSPDMVVAFKLQADNLYLGNLAVSEDGSVPAVSIGQAYIDKSAGNVLKVRTV